MRILLTFALPEEGADFCRRLRNRKRERAVLLGELSGIMIGVVWLGIGMRNEENIRAAMDWFRPAVVVSSGFAGAVRTLLEPGDFLVAKNYSNPVLIQKSKQFVDGIGPFFCGTQVASRAEKQRLNQKMKVAVDPSPGTSVASNPTDPSVERDGWIAIDMESNKLADLCEEARVPLLVARMISDRLDEEIPTLFTGSGCKSLRELWWTIHFAIRMLWLRTVLASKLTAIVAAIQAGCRAQE
jgi:nucleoside phosphorylase